MKNEDMIPCQDLVEDSNNSNNTHFQTILDQYTSRRSFIAKTTSGAMALAFAATVSGCSDDDNDSGTPDTNPTTPPDALSMIMLAVPMWLLFELGLLAGKLIEKRRLKAQ